MDLHVNKDALSFYNDSFTSICLTMDIVELNRAFDYLDVSRRRGVCLLQNNLNNENNDELCRLPVALYEIVNYKNK